MKITRKYWFSLFIFAVLSLGIAGSAEERFLDNCRFGAPGGSDALLVRERFVIGYSNAHKQALWSSYNLKAEHLQETEYKRKNRFRKDPLLAAAVVHPGEYANTGYDKGHLIPARDMAFFPVALDESFFMSNISPQSPRFNRGVWKRLESEVRKITLREKDLLVITGPVWSKEQNETMARTDIPVPVAFFKVIFDLTPPEKMIAFVIPHNASRKQPKSFAMTVSQVEKLTGLDFFPELPAEQQRKLESTLDINEWQLSTSGKEKP